MNWQPIETAPQDGTAILVYLPAETRSTPPCITTVYWEGPNKWDRWGSAWRLCDPGEFGDGQPVEEPTHWMPLPEPPK